MKLYESHFCLKQFDKFLKTGNGNYANLLKSILEKFVKAHQGNLFLAGFTHLKPLCTTSPRPNDQNPKTANSSDTNLELDMPKLLELAHLVHYVYTPILFLPKWRYEAHSTRLRIRSEVIDSDANLLLPSLSESGKKKLRFSSNEEREHLSVLK